MDLDASLIEVSEQLKRSQLLRRLSGNASTASARSRRAMARVMKPRSGNNSPHGIQRRRTTASHTASAYQPYPYDSQPQYHHIPDHYRFSIQPSSARPLSWHPGSRPFSRPAERFPVEDSAMRKAITSFQPGELSGSRYPITMHDESLMPVIKQESSHWPSEGLSQSGLSMDGYGYSTIRRPESSFVPFPLDYSSNQNSTEISPLQYSAYPESPTDTSAAAWSGFQPEYLNISQSQTLDYLQTHIYPEPLPTATQDSKPPLSRKRSNELVGMGLYNNDPNFSSLDNGSLGKGLKLEETWEPPKDEDSDKEDEEDESYSTDDGDEELPATSHPEEAQEPLYPAYGDLSNQTFFFDNDDPYQNPITLDPGLPQTYQVLQQPKSPEMAKQNFLWF